ncbi:hypothetical protein WJX79_009534 [Trebouxia sp. C0005]
MAVTQDARNKVVVRKLPPGISQEEVQAAIDAVCQGKYDWFTFVPGKVSIKRVKHSRAYLNFLDAAEVFRFRAQFGGHAFVNKKGAQYKCTVEYAPYQKVPREKAKDPREGTYENDADFMAFKQQAEGDPELLPSAEVQLELKEQAKKAVTETSLKPKVTPLMQFLHDKHSLKSDKKAPILVPVKKKSSKANADLDLPPHLANKPPPSSQTTPSKPPSNHQQTPTSRSSNSKPSVLPIPVSDAGPSGAANQSQQCVSGNDAQDGDKPSRKVRPGFQTWAPRRGGRGEEEEAEDAGPPGVHALTAARAAAAAALRAENKAAGRLAQSQADRGSSPTVPSQGGWDPEPVPQPANSGWDNEPPPHLAASPNRGRGQDRWGYPVSPDPQAAAGRQSDPRGRGRGRDEEVRVVYHDQLGLSAA